jgi:type IX secretion system PorP/SprF family membrane protein
LPLTFLFTALYLNIFATIQHPLMKSILIIAIFLVVSYAALSQVAGPLGFYNYDPMLTNPAFAGLINEQNYQIQYSGRGHNFDGYPFTAFTAFSTQLTKINSGIGAMLWRSRIGVHNETNASLLYDYQFKFGAEHCLSIGAQMGYSRILNDYSILDSVEPIPSKKYNVIIADFGFAYRISNFYLGISTQNMLRSQESDYVTSSPAQYYKFYSMYEFNVASWLKFKPSILANTDFKSQPNLEINGILVVREILLAGVSVETWGDYTFQKYNAGVDIKKKLQIIGTVYSEFNHWHYSSSSNNIELMVRLRIANKSNL